MQIDNEHLFLLFQLAACCSFPIPLHMLPSFLMIALRFLLVLPLRKRERQVASSLSHMVVNSIAISIYIAKPSRFDVLAAHLSIFVTVHGMKSFVARSIYMIQMYATRAEPQIVLPSTAWIIYSIDWFEHSFCAHTATSMQFGDVSIAIILVKL